MGGCSWELVLRQNHVVEDAVRNVKFTSYRGAIGGVTGRRNLTAHSHNEITLNKK